MKRKPNPIVAAAKRGLKLKEGRLFFPFTEWDELPQEQQRDLVRGFFTDEAIYEIGCLLAGALIAGDKQMDKTVRAAIKESARMFGLNLEKALLEKLQHYMFCRWPYFMFKHRGDGKRAVDDLKKGFEQECNNGIEIDQYRWSRLRRASGLPKRSCVRHDRRSWRGYRSCTGSS